MHSVVKIIPKTQYTFDAGTVRDIVLAKYVNTASWVSGVLVVRVHTAPGSSADPKVVVQNASYTEEEPNTIFYTATNETSQTVAAGDLLLVKQLNTPIGDRVRVILKTPSAGGTGVTFTISAELIGRDA
jgi:hypothetical protein